MRKLKTEEINSLSIENFKKKNKIHLVILLENIRSVYNVGSIFRISDSFLIEKICLCGITATPKNNFNIHKTALGSEFSVNWKYYKNSHEALIYYKLLKYNIIAIEQTNKSFNLNNFIIENNKKYLLIFGNEVKGVEQSIIDICDCSIEIEQFGTKHSLNVSVSAGIVIWEFFNIMKINTK